MPLTIQLFKLGIRWPPYTSWLMAVLELGLNGISPTLGANFLLWVLPFPWLGDGSSTGPTALWIDNSEIGAVVKDVFIYNEYIWGKSTDELQTRIRQEGRKDSTISNNNLKYL